MGLQSRDNKLSIKEKQVLKEAMAAVTISLNRLSELFYNTRDSMAKLQEHLQILNGTSEEVIKQEAKIRREAWRTKNNKETCE